MKEEKKWYAVYTKSHCEKKVSNLLIKKGIENYCPLNKIHKQWSDRKKIILEPLFKSYVFVNISQVEQIIVRETNGILNFVYWLGKPAVIRNAEIEIIQRFTNEHTFVRLEKAMVDINDQVRIISGPLMDLQGKVVSIHKKTVKIILPSLGYWMCVEIETTNVKFIGEHSISQRALYFQK